MFLGTSGRQELQSHFQAASQPDAETRVSWPALPRMTSKDCYPAKATTRPASRSTKRPAQSRQFAPSQRCSSMTHVRAERLIPAEPAPSCVSPTRSSNANSLCAQNSAGFLEIRAIFQRDNLRRQHAVGLCGIVSCACGWLPAFAATTRRRLEGGLVHG